MASGLFGADRTKRLVQQIEAGRQLLKKAGEVSAGEFDGWFSATEGSVSRIYGTDSPELKGFRSTGPRPTLREMRDNDLGQNRRERLEEKISLLHSLVESVDDTEDDRHSSADWRDIGGAGSTTVSTPKMDSANREQFRLLLRSAKALLESMNASIANDQTDHWRFTAYWTFARKYNVLFDSVAAVLPMIAALDKYDLEKVPTIGNTVPIQQKEIFYSVHANLSILCAYLESSIGIKGDEVANLANFFQVNLRKVLFAPPEKELEVQNGVEQLLIGKGYEKGVDYDRETGRVKVSIKEFVPDFIFQRLGLALEVKLSKDATKSRALVDEINADIQAYGKKYAFVLFIVYDLGSIRDEQEFKRDLELLDSVTVIVVKH